MEIQLLFHLMINGLDEKDRYFILAFPSLSPQHPHL